MKIIFTFILFVIINSSLYCQTESAFFENHVVTLPKITPPPHSDTCQTCLKPCGKKFKAEISIDKWSQYVTDSCKIFSLEISAPGAYYLDIIFKKFNIQPHCILRVYSSDNTYQEYTSLYSKNNGVLKVLTTKGSSAFIKYFVFDSIEINNDLEISSITYIYDSDAFDYSSSLKSLSCQHDVNCPEGDPYRDIIRSIVLIRNLCDDNVCWRCSGSLLNNTSEDYTPYILTAHHCTQGVDDNLDEAIFCFNWQNVFCNGYPPYSDDYDPYILTGAELKAQRTPTMGSDFALLKLIETPPLYYNVFYSGWSREWGLIGSNVVGIHHPGFDPKKISFGHVQGISVGDYLNVKWDDGTVEDGSSGSPIFKNQQVVGQLSGGLGNNDCDNLGDDLYGHFASSWSSTWGPDRRLKDWLDPNETDPDNWDGTDPRNECTTDLYLFGVYPRTDYQSEPVVIQAANTINISNMVVQSYGNYKFKAGHEIVLTNFETKVGAEVEIIPCDNDNPPHVVNIEKIPSVICAHMIATLKAVLDQPVGCCYDLNNVTYNWSVTEPNGNTPPIPDNTASIDYDVFWPGLYHFQVQAVNNFGVSNTYGKNIEVLSVHDCDNQLNKLVHNDTNSTIDKTDFSGNLLIFSQPHHQLN